VHNFELTCVSSNWREWPLKKDKNCGFVNSAGSLNINYYIIHMKYIFWGWNHLCWWLGRPLVSSDWNQGETEFFVHFCSRKSQGGVEVEMNLPNVSQDEFDMSLTYWNLFQMETRLWFGSNFHGCEFGSQTWWLLRHSQRPCLVAMNKRTLLVKITKLPMFNFMRFSEPQRMCEQLLLFRVFLVFRFCIFFVFFSV
jgi:hypothetical protein